MNTTITVLLGILGTLAGVVLGFFAEPIKSWFNNKSKLSYIRGMLYKETFHNFTGLISALESDVETDAKGFLELLSGFLRTEGYRHAIANEVVLFYQLKESTPINYLYLMIETILTFDNTSDATDLYNSCRIYIGLVQEYLNSDVLSKRYMSEMVDNHLMKKFLSTESNWRTRN